VKRAAGNGEVRVRRDSRERVETNRASTGNAVNPRIGSGMQQARDSAGGENRRGGATPRGRNGISRLDASRPKRDQRWSGGSGRQRSTSMEGQGRSDAIGQPVSQRIGRETGGSDGHISREDGSVRPGLPSRCRPGRHERRFESKSTERVPQHRFRPMRCGTGVIPRRPAP